MYNVYLSGFVGNLGTKYILEKNRVELLKHFSVSYIDKVLKDLKKSIDIGGLYPLLDCPKIDIEPVIKGGFLAALWKVCDRNNFGLKYSLSEVKLLQGTIEISNYYNINPYRLLTENSYIVILDEQISINDKIIYGYYNGDINMPFTKIGEIVEGKKRVRIDSETESFLIKDYKDEIDKI